MVEEIFITNNWVLAMSNDAIDNSTITKSANPRIIIPQGSSSATNEIYFVPNILNISAGTTVNWTNGDLISYESFELEQIHTVTSGNVDTGNIGREFDSGFLHAGKSFHHTFNSTGTFDYFCFIHPFMTGTIVVS
ncbi:MAG TPA: plastocyanin/azurin family copper-binding protein [Nitrososphaeraceae archaeon]|nr:plastocyanin/azurin family copper-binding protein [Nitrososphaeraceae archaeon]